MPITYEVNVRVEREIESEYRAWLALHIQQVIALPGFIAAQLFEVCLPWQTNHVKSRLPWQVNQAKSALEAGDGERHFQLCVHYRLSDRAALDSYLELHAPGLRAEGVQRFGNRFNATRRVLLPAGEIFPAMLNASDGRVVS